MSSNHTFHNAYQNYVRQLMEMFINRYGSIDLEKAEKELTQEYKDAMTEIAVSHFFVKNNFIFSFIRFIFTGNKTSQDKAERECYQEYCLQLEALRGRHAALMKIKDNLAVIKEKISAIEEKDCK